MAATYSAAVNATNPAVVDTNSTQETGAAIEGIGLSGSDGVSLAGSRIGGEPGTDFKFETNE